MRSAAKLPILATIVAALSGATAVAGNNPAGHGTRIPAAIPDGTAFSRIEIGGRFVYPNLTEPKKIEVNTGSEFEGFLGSIYKLDEEQQWWPMPFLRLNFCKYAGAEFTWDYIKAKTVTWSEGDNWKRDPDVLPSGGLFYPEYTDGSFVLEGPLFSLFARYPNSTVFTPCIGGGIGIYSADFCEYPWWHGDGPAGPGPVLQWIDTKNPVSPFVFLSCDIKAGERWVAELYVRYTDIQVDSHYYITLRDGTMLEDKGWTEFPMSYVGYGASARYCF